MKHLTSLLHSNPRVWGLAVAFWIIVFIISAFFINPETGEPTIGLYQFHAVMFVISLALMYALFRWFQKKHWLSVATYNTFLLVQVALDFAILVPFFGVGIDEWFSLILPAYVVGTAIVYFSVGEK